VYFQSDEVNAAIVTCGGLCPGLNTVIRELVCGLYDMYGVSSVVGIEVRTEEFNGVRPVKKHCLLVNLNMFFLKQRIIRDHNI
jgi:hypothetical protein